MTLSESVGDAEARYATELREKLDAIIRTFDGVKADPNAKIPTRLALVIHNARTDEQKVAMYADTMCAADLLSRYEGRPEHDRTTWGVPLRAGQ